MSEYDVIVVGAGTGGSVTAAAVSRMGLKVALLDRWPKEKVGVKVCGDATSQFHFSEIKDIIPIEPPTIENGEVRQWVHGASLVSPDHKTKFRMVEEGSTGCIIDRFKMGMRLLDTAIDNGAEFIDEAMVKKPIVENNKVTGIEYRDKDKNIKEIKAKVTVDASGIVAVLRNQLDPEKTHMDTSLLPKDVCNCYREVRDIKTEFEDRNIIRIYFDQELCPGGYLWEFPRGTHSINAGLGVMKMFDMNPKKQFELYLKREKDLYEGSTLIHGGGWRVPLRRPIDNLVWNGFMLVGDSGTQVKPTDGGGIGISIQAAAMAAETIKNALEKNDVSMNSLWDYNVKFMRKIAPINAPLAIFKDFIIPLPSNIINTVMGKGVIDGSDLLYGNNSGEISSGFKKNLKRAWKGRSVLGTLFKMRGVLSKMDEARDLYSNFPETYADWSPWQARIKEIYNES